MHYKLRHDVEAFANLVPMALAIVICFAILFVGIFVNGAISDNLVDSLGSGHIPQTTENRLNNITEDQDSAIDIVQVVIIITVLAAAIGAIFLFTRFR